MLTQIVSAAWDMSYHDWLGTAGLDTVFGTHEVDVATAKGRKTVPMLVEHT